jgi:hypothetical protein
MKQYGRNAIAMMIKEGTYGTQTQDLISANVIQGNLTITPNIEPIECNEKTGKTYKNETQLIQGQKKPTASMTGELSSSLFSILLTAATHDGSYKLGNISARPYTLYVYDIENETYDCLIGAVCTDFTVTGTQGDKLTFSANFRGSESRFDIADVGADALTNVPTVYNAQPMLFQNVTADVMGIGSRIANLVSFNLTLTNEYQDDTLSYFNNQTRQQEVVCKQTGTFGFSYAADTDTNDYIHDNLINTIRKADLRINIGGGRWDITIYGVFLNYENPMDTECQRILTAEMEIREDVAGENDPLTITYTPL